MGVGGIAVLLLLPACFSQPLYTWSFGVPCAIDLFIELRTPTFSKRRMSCCRPWRAEHNCLQFIQMINLVHGTIFELPTHPYLGFPHIHDLCCAAKQEMGFY